MPTISDITVERVIGTRPADGMQERVGIPLDLYSEHEDFSGPLAFSEAPTRADEVRGLYVEVHTDDGIAGIFGPIQLGQAYVILSELRPFLIGRDALANELLLDQMLRLNRHGRSGTFMTAVSPIDCALWDVRGKYFGEPVFRVLGGPTRPRVPAYASMLGHSIDPDDAAKAARAHMDLGFQAQKWFFRFGPVHGSEGIDKNLRMAQAVRDAVGPHYELMFDCFMSWDVTYAKRMVRLLEPLNPKWLEEPVPPERVSELRRIRNSSTVPIATGEHVFTRWQTKELLVNDAVDFLQNDPDWTGGITELAKICALASSFEVPFVAHGHSLLSALHVAASQSPAVVPMVEFLVLLQPRAQHFHAVYYGPEQGSIALPELPGLGLVLDENKIESREPVTF